MSSVIQFSDECLMAAKEVQSGKAQFCMFQIHNASECSVEVISRDKSEGRSCEERWEGFTQHLPKERCVYGLVNFSYMSPCDQIERTKVVFLYWAPSTAKMKEKMVTAFSSNAIVAKIGGGISSRLQGGSIACVEYNEVMQQVLSRATVK
jgi:cofilin